MIWQMIEIALLLIALGILVMVSSLLPFLMPFTFAYILRLIYIDISALLVFWVVMSFSILTWIARYYWHIHIMTYMQREHPKLVNKKIDITQYTWWKKLAYVQNNIYLLSIFTAISARSLLPDMLLIYVVRKKMPIHLRLISYVVGKSVVYGMIIFPWTLFMNYISYTI